MPVDRNLKLETEEVEHESGLKYRRKVAPNSTEETPKNKAAQAPGLVTSETSAPKGK